MTKEWSTVPVLSVKVQAFESPESRKKPSLGTHACMCSTGKQRQAGAGALLSANMYVHMLEKEKAQTAAGMEKTNILHIAVETGYKSW